MLDISLALIFSQLPHPECWMPRLPLEALNCFWLALPAWFLVLAWFSCLCGGGGVRLQTLLLFMCVCNWPLAAEVPVHCEVCVRLWSFYCLHRITTVLIVQCCSPLSPHPPPVAQTLLVFSTQTEFNPNVVCLQNREFRPLLSLPPLLLCCLVFLTLFLFSDLNCRRFQSLSPSKADPRESALGRKKKKRKKKPLFDNVCLSLR